MANFDHIAPVYDLLAGLVFGKAIKAAQVHFLDQLPSDGRVLVIGGGTGWIVEELVGRRSGLEIDYVEASAKMLEKSQLKMKGRSEIRFVHGTEDDIPEEEYDMIMTNFFLDVFETEKLEKVITVLRSKLKATGIWLVSDFRSTGKRRHNFLLRLMHLFFRYSAALRSKELKDFRYLLSSRELMETDYETFYQGMIFSAVYRPNAL